METLLLWPTALCAEHTGQTDKQSTQSHDWLSLSGLHKLLLATCAQDAERMMVRSGVGSE